MKGFSTEVKKLICIPAAVFLLMAMVFAVPISVRTADAEIPGIQITAPADGGTAVPEVSDYAMEHFSDPWDMSQITDIAGGGTHRYGISNFSVSGGTLSGTSSNNDPSFFLVHPATFESIPTGRDGLLYPIDTSAYDTLSVRMYVSKFTWVQIYWFYNQVWTDFGVTNYGIPAGWGTYNIDLSSNPEWTGNPIGLRFDPASDANISFIIDWVKLKRNGTDDNKVNIQWTDSNPGSYVMLMIDQDNIPQSGNEDYVAYIKSNAANSYQMDVSRYAAGTYYFYLQKSGDTTSLVSFSVSQPPLPVITDPDSQGGQDFASVYGSDPWDMSQVSDIAASYNVTGLGSNGTFIGGVSTNNDPHLYLRMPISINTSIYHRLTFRFTYDGSFDLQDGTMSRFIWGHSGMNPSTFQISEDIVTNPMWWTYTIDLKQSALEGGSIGWNGSVNVMRFDPLETIINRYFALDYVKLCADDEAATTFPIKWKENKTSPLPTTVSLYYDNDNQGYNGTLIAAGISQQAGENTYDWDTRPVPAGLYYIYMVATDGIGTNRVYSSGPVRVQALSYAAVNPAKTWAPSFSGKKGGPLEVRTNKESVVTQRVHYNNSFNEVEGIPESKLSTYFIFPWYDHKSGGMSNWLLVTNTNSSTANISIKLGGETVSSQQVQPYRTWTATFPGQMDGPLEINSDIPVAASQRVHLFSSFNEIMGIPQSQLSTDIVFPWYDQLNPNMKDWLIVTNPNNSTATISVALKGETLVSNVQIAPYSSWTPSFSQKCGGPLRVTSSIPVAASQRVHYYNTNFNEVSGIPMSSLSTEYTFSWYDQKSSGMSDWVIVANPGNSAAQVSIKREGNTIATNTVQPNQTWTPSFPGIYGGTLQVTSDQPVAVSQRVHYLTSFNEFMGVSQADYSTHWIFPWYDQVSSGMKDWLMIGNPDNQSMITNATVKREGCY